MHQVYNPVIPTRSCEICQSVTAMELFRDQIQMTPNITTPHEASLNIFKFEAGFLNFKVQVNGGGYLKHY